MSFFIMILSLTALGFTGLAAAMSKHQKQFFDVELSSNKTHLAKWVGWLLLIISMLLCTWQLNVANGLSYWLCAITASAFLVMGVLSYYPKQFKTLCISSSVLFVISLVIHLI